MKTTILGTMMGLLLATSAFASELRPLVGTCVSKEDKVSLHFYPHADVMTTGLVDVVVNADLGSFFGKENYLINDILATASKVAGENKTKLYFTNQDVTLDVVIDNVTNTARLLVEGGKRITLKCGN